MEKGKEKEEMDKKKKKKGKEREREERSLGGFRGGDRGRSRTRAGRACHVGRGGTERRNSCWIRVSGPIFREIGQGNDFEWIELND